MSMEAFESEFSDLFKTLPPIKRAELTKVFWVRPRERFLMKMK